MKQILNHFYVCCWMRWGKNGKNFQKATDALTEIKDTVRKIPPCKCSVEYKPIWNSHINRASQWTEDQKGRTKKKRYNAVSRPIVATLIPPKGDLPDSNCQFKCCFLSATAASLLFPLDSMSSFIGSRSFSRCYTKLHTIPHSAFTSSPPCPLW